MVSSMPIPLIISWILFSGFVNTHQRHARHFQGASQGYLFALYASVTLGSLAGLGLLVYYFIQVSWYWPLVLFLGGSLVGGILFGFFDAKIGLLGLSLASFIGWPSSAIWAFLIIRDLHP
jgi:hypothetical protein